MQGAQPQNPQQNNQEPKEEKLEFLKREEVRTMAKDIAKVREVQAKKERERIANLKELPKKPQVVLSQHPEGKPGVILNGSTEASSIAVKQLTPVPRRSLKRSEKLFIRLVVGGIILFLIFNAVAFGFWYFFKKDAPKQPEPKGIQQKEVLPQVSITPEPIPSPEPQPEASPPQTKTPAFFFEAPQQKLFLETPEELVGKLQIFLAENPAPGFLNIVVNIQENILSSEQFLKGAGIAIPQELKENITENLMLFSFVAQQKKRLGFVVELKETQGVSELLQLWEQSMEQDLASFFDIIGSKGSAYTPFFRSSVYQEIPVRFQTFSVIDFGIVYGIIDNKLLLTSSFESFKRVVDQLKNI